MVRIQGIIKIPVRVSSESREFMDVRIRISIGISVRISVEISVFLREFWR